MNDKIKAARYHAERLKARASVTTDPESKALLLDVAAGWMELADELRVLEAREKTKGYAALGLVVAADGLRRASTLFMDLMRRRFDR